jgi:hypothetical protein
MKTLRAIWIGIGVLALLATLRAIVLSQHAGSTRAIWINSIAAAFALTVLASAVSSNRSLAARRILATCWVLTVVYCVAFTMLVGLEFGALWLVVAILVGVLSITSIWIMRRKQTSRNTQAV